MSETKRTQLDAQVKLIVTLAGKNRGKGTNVTILPLVLTTALRVAIERGVVEVVTRPGRRTGSTQDFLVLPQA